MTNQDLVSCLSELVDKMTANTLALSPKQIVDGQLEQELTRLSALVQEQKETGLISQERSQAALALISGLYLWNGNMDSSHTISQDLENRTGSYLHGILHRMEPDFSNAKYWFRMAGGHPNGDLLQQKTLEILRESTSGNEALYRKFKQKTTWNPELLTDMVAAAALQTRGTEDEVLLLERIQAIELRLLLEVVLRELDKR
jgi:hypothetical protein